MACFNTTFPAWRKSSYANYHECIAAVTKVEYHDVLLWLYFFTAEPLNATLVHWNSDMYMDNLLKAANNC